MNVKRTFNIKHQCLAVCWKFESLTNRNKSSNSGISMCCTITTWAQIPLLANPRNLDRIGEMISGLINDHSVISLPLCYCSKKVSGKLESLVSLAYTRITFIHEPCFLKFSRNYLSTAIAEQVHYHHLFQLPRQRDEERAGEVVPSDYLLPWEFHKIFLKSCLETVMFP